MTDYTRNTNGMNSVLATHPEFYHYTSADGIYGIIQEGKLRATHWMFLNDKEERIAFYERRLPHLLRVPIKNAIEKLLKEGTLHEGNFEGKTRGDVENDLVNTFVEQFRKQLALDVPHILSLSSVPASPHLGQLSQWRGYGLDGGYALVFDAKGLLESAELVSKEKKILMLGMDVEYIGENGADHTPNDDVAEQEEILQQAVEKFLVHNAGSDAFEPAYIPVMALSMRYKHIGFEEEREFRIVAVPDADGMVSSTGLKPLFRNKSGLLVPYIELPIRRDCIKRIIVGPHPDKERRKQSIDILTRAYGMSCEIVTSNIPYIG